MLISLYRKYINNGDSRFSNLKKNVFWSFIIKGVSILLGLLKVPILLSYLNQEKYGVWLTIASVVMWVSYFDLGLGHGLRNKLAEALARNEKDRIKGLISTAYLSMSVIMLGLMTILTPLILSLDWNSFLNIPISSVSNVELKYTIWLTLIMFCLRFIFHLITVVLKAIQKPAISDTFLPIESILSLILVLILKYIYPDSLLLASASLSVTPVVVLFIANVVFLRKYFSDCRIKVSNYNKLYLNDIYSLGFKFFIGQMCSLIMFSSQNFIISKILNSEEVTTYNIARTYYTLPNTLFTLILTPYWSAITDAFIRNEYIWIKSNMKKLFKIGIIFSLGLIIMLLFSNIAFRLWVGSSVKIPLELSIGFTLYNIFVLLFSPYTYFLNGVGKLKLGIYVAVFKVLLFLPIAIYFTTLFGSVGLLITLFIVNMLPSMFINVIQYNKIIKGTAQGIWNK